jgi:NADPH:quinone reductase
MKAIVLNSFGSADNFAAADLPIPKLRKGEVRIKVKAVSFNPVDYQIRKGQPESSRVRSMILGRDLSGSVDAVHEDVTDFNAGDEVFSYVCDLASSGTYVEYVPPSLRLFDLESSVLQGVVSPCGLRCTVVDSL